MSTTTKAPLNDDKTPYYSTNPMLPVPFRFPPPPASPMDEKDKKKNANEDGGPIPKKYKTYYLNNAAGTYGGETSYSSLEAILDQEKQLNRGETWNKLEKQLKIQKLHAFAEKYGKEHAFPVKDVKSLKSFFLDSLEKGKLQRSKDVLYNKDHREITAIPALFFHGDTRAFTLRNLGPTSASSTLKSLTPKIRAVPNATFYSNGMADANGDQDTNNVDTELQEKDDDI